MSVILTPVGSGGTIPAELLALVQGKVRDSAQVLASADYEQGISEAAARYCSDRPRLLVADITGTGATDYPLPEGWTDGLSTVVSIEYPVGGNPETLLDQNQWQVYRSPSGLVLRFRSAPASGSVARLLYTGSYSTAEIPAHDRDAVMNLAAGICCRMLAARYAQTGDPTIMADSVNYRSKMDEFRRLADSYEAQYRTHLGIKEGEGGPAACATATVTTKRQRLTHRR